ncbi:MAG: polyribonucleotide nucleotidyltransferase [Bacteroidetes bacterium]|nr:polyribonucleotide nucleotidyltransferase [Rhodothermia bacterium]MCS7154830.1 polyribonucleotide nucleotidyltransferase [Bacteroidota bacterium]MCX7907012.1 polyribonucleotide nucleotidyltransferase [Bacteroidota bacterium]MDW8137624.1 polyribonucleotide nucleotidyltransferase [Bacteroidota bacterium]MDW8285422.1 polyribonucleotide nucleotidyltransferase [Bacteroidota bacterium]
MHKPTLWTTTVELEPGRPLQVETGRLARQADGSAVVRLGDTMVLCTVCASPSPREGQSFFPLTVEYREKYYAGGKFPGGFIKREGRPNEKEILSARLIDRAIRPLFPEGFLNEVQVICTVISSDGQNDADVLAGIGASAAILLSDLPYNGPMAEVRVGRLGGRWVLFPTIAELEQSDCNMVVAGTSESIIMVEGELKEVSESDMLEAIAFAHEAIRRICQAQLELVHQRFGGPRPVRPFEVPVWDEALWNRVEELARPRLREILRRPYVKAEYQEAIRALKEEVIEQLTGLPVAVPETEEGPPVEVRTPVEEEVGLEGVLPEQEIIVRAPEFPDRAAEVARAFDELEYREMRRMILEENRRLDGRRTDEIRPIWCEVGLLPRVHGSALFTRGETQALASVTLGTKLDEQIIDELFYDTSKSFMLHYNFPPFSTGEVKPIRGVSRREVGHGNLAERALRAVLPSREVFPYTIRVVSEILESNGSSSMATVCAGSLALMDAGVPIRKAVAGIAMGLIKEQGQVAILSDILGAEDHLGDMDFKVAGTRDGITACQMDIKISGISLDILARALEQARQGRLQILDLMDQVLAEPRPDLSPHAPRLTTLEIDVSDIGAVIGPAGRVIQEIQRETKTEIVVEEKDGRGLVTIAATDAEAAQRAIEWISRITAKPVEGQIYEGVVRSIQPFGAFVEILPGKDGLLHVSEIAHRRVENVSDYLKVGDRIRVQLIRIEEGGKLRLSMKSLLPKPEGEQLGPERRPANGGSGRPSQTPPPRGGRSPHRGGPPKSRR